MLNRIFIVVGTLMILAIVAAFFVPNYWDWNPYRARLEAMAEEALGAPVTIRGDLHLSILPQPRMILDDVLVGPPDAPVAEIGRIEAEFALMEFLRDRYDVAELVLENPRFHFDIGADGTFAFPINLASQVSTTNVAIRNADITGAEVTLNDRRTGETFSASNVDASLRLSALRGPFSLQASGIFEGAPYQLRINTSDPNPDGDIRLSVFLSPAGGRFSISADGVMTPGAMPRFVGTSSWQYQPEQSEDVREVRGAAILDASIEANPSRLLLTNFTFVPDETQAGTRLSGAADVRLGADRRFSTVISGGVISLIQTRSLTEAVEIRPYPVLSLIENLPVPPAFGLPGEISMDIAELDLEGLSLREVRLDASTDGSDWTLGTLEGRMPGETMLRLAGRTSGENERLRFDGTLAIDSARLDAFARSWRQLAEDNPLFGVAGSLSAAVVLDESGLTLNGGQVMLGGSPLRFTAKVARGDDSGLTLTTDLGALDARPSSQLAALLPNAFAEPEFALTFPRGHLDLSADAMVWRDRAFEDVKLAALWGPDGITVENLVAADATGSSISASGRLTGTFVTPHIGGSADIVLAPGVALDNYWQLTGSASLPSLVSSAIAANLPVDASLALGDVQGGAQRLDISAISGPARLDASVSLGSGILGGWAAPLEISATIDSPDRTALAIALGAPPAIAAGLVRGEEARLTLAAHGSFAGGLDSAVEFTAGDERMAYDGGFNFDPATGVAGRGRLDLKISDFVGYADLFGLDGISLPSLLGVADIAFEGADALTATRIDAVIGGERVIGDLSLLRNGSVLDYEGALATGSIDLVALGAFLGGSAALVPGEGAWPIGPVSLGDRARTSRGRIGVTATNLAYDGRNFLDAVAFDFAWDATENRIRELRATLGEGRLTADIRLCCASELLSKQMSGRFALSGVALDQILPPAIAARLSGVLEAGAQLTGSGASFADIAASLGGEGSFAIDDFSISGFNARVFETVAGLDNVLDLEPADLTSEVAETLGTGSYDAGRIEGVFRIAAGDARITNFASETGGVRLLGDSTLDLASFALNSSWTLAPTAPVGGNGLINEQTGRITTIVEGPFENPAARLDVARMVDALKMRAFEIEVARLEALRAEEEARARSAAVENQRQLADRYIALSHAARTRAADEAMRLAQARIDDWIERQAALIAAAEAGLEAFRDADEAARIAEEQAAIAATPAPPPPRPSIINVPPLAVDQPIQLIPR